MPEATHPASRGLFPPSLEHSLVADAMSPAIVSCPADATPAKAAQVMAAHRLHSVFVMHRAFDDPEAEYVWGIVSDLDLVRAALDPDDAQRASSLAGTPIVSVEPTMRLVDACALIVKYRLSHLVVVDPEMRRPVGVLSTTDVVDVLAWGEA